MAWSRSDALAAVRSILSTYRADTWIYERADLDDDQVLVIFRLDASAPVRPAPDLEARYGVYYSLVDLPNGPSTGLAADTPEEWAGEIGWDLDEQVDTGGVGRAEHSPGPDGLILLRWRG